MRVLIDKQAAIDAIKNLCEECDADYCGECRIDYPVKDAKSVLGALPPAEPKRGKWTLKSYRWECDQCGCLIRRENPFKGNEWNYNYCPNCGAKMER